MDTVPGGLRMGGGGSWFNHAIKEVKSAVRIYKSWWRTPAHTHSWLLNCELCNGWRLCLHAYVQFTQAIYNPSNRFPVSHTGLLHYWVSNPQSIWSICYCYPMPSTRMCIVYIQPTTNGRSEKCKQRARIHLCKLGLADTLTHTHTQPHHNRAYHKLNHCILNIFLFTNDGAHRTCFMQHRAGYAAHTSMYSNQCSGSATLWYGSASCSILQWHSRCKQKASFFY
jgi:hypothetical protein